MKISRVTSGMDRRHFLAATGGGLLAAAVPAAGDAASVVTGNTTGTPPEVPPGQRPPRNPPCARFPSASLTRSTKTSPWTPCSTKSAPSALKPWRSAPAAIPNRITVHSTNSWPTHPKPKLGRKNSRIEAFTSPLSVVTVIPSTRIPSTPKKTAETFRNTVLLAERLGVKVIVGFSGCPGGSASDTQPNWVTYRWPPEYAAMQDWQWKERVVPYWKEAAKFAREHGIHKLAFEMHPNFVVYNPRTLLKLREAVGEEIGANCDLSHLFWQGCDPVEVIHFLGKQGAIYHAHMKDTAFYPDNVNKYGVLNFAFETKDLPLASETFRAVGYGHGAELWKSIMKAYMDIDYQGIFSIENEDPILSGEVGVERAAYVLKNVRNELLGT